MRNSQKDGERDSARGTARSTMRGKHERDSERTARGGHSERWTQREVDSARGTA